MMKNEKVRNALEDLEAVILRAAQDLRDDGTLGGTTEHERRTAALQGISEILEDRPLSSWPADRLSFLEILLSFWRLAESPLDASPPAQGPDRSPEENENLRVLSRSLHVCAAVTTHGKPWCKGACANPRNCIASPEQQL